MQKIKAFLSDHKVLIFGLFSAAIMTVQQLSSDYPTDYGVLAFAALIATISYLSKSLRGQWPTILGSVLPSLGVVLTSMETHTQIGWWQLIGSLGLAIGGAVAPPAKSLSYEKTPVIEAAKGQASSIDASSQPPKTPPVSTK